MFTLKRLIGGSLFVFVLAGTALAQETRAPIDTPREAVAPIPAAPLVTAAATAARVRFVSPGTVVQLRLEVYNEAGQKLFDTELHGGNVLDWHLQDGAGQRLAAGSYACVLTIKSLSGRLSQRVGLVTVNEKEAAVEAAGAAQLSQLSIRQQQTIGPVEGNAAFTILQESEAEAITTVTHDGAEGQVTRTRGALSFRVGDLFSGKDKEQMRLTEDGRLGIGTSDPKANLDVAGTIRAERVLITKPRNPVSDNKTNAGDAALTSDAEDSALLTGSGTQNRIAKWTDNAGTLGDSGISETVAGLVGIGTTSPTHKLDVQSPGANAAIRSVNEAPGVRGMVTEQHSSNVVGAVFVGLKSRGTLASPSAVVPGDFGGFFSNKWYDGTSYVQSGAFGVTVDGPVSTGVVPTRLSFVTSTTSGDGPTAHGLERMSILSGGNVGIGTPSPIYKLDVVHGGATGIHSQSTSSFSVVDIDAADGDAALRLQRAGVGQWNIRNEPVNNDLQFFQLGGGGERMRIQRTTGNVGIGTTAPKAKLHVVGGSIYIAQPNSLVITSPNGNCWFITVSDTGVLSSFSVTCP